MKLSHLFGRLHAAAWKSSLFLCHREHVTHPQHHGADTARSHLGPCLIKSFAISDGKRGKAENAGTMSKVVL